MEIETRGFCQLVTGNTRTWKNQNPSLLDQIWSNCDERTISVFNNVCGSSDHNLVGIKIAMREIKIGGQTIKKRCWKNADMTRFREKFQQIDWTELYSQTNVDLANSILEN